MNEEQPTPKPAPKPTSGEWQHANWVSSLGKWAWIIGIVNGIFGIIFSLWGIGVGTAANVIWAPIVVYSPASDIWWIIVSIVGIFISFTIIRPKFSKPCGEKDWEALYSWILNLGGTKVPWMFVWGLILFLFGWYGWGGLAVLIPAIMLIFAGPRKYEWSE